MKVRIAIFTVIAAAIASYMVYRGILATRERSEVALPSETAAPAEPAQQNPDVIPAQPIETIAAVENPPDVSRDGEGIIAGQVLLPGRYPAQDATVQIYAMEPDGDPQPFTATIDTDGRFVRPGLQFGWYHVFASQDNQADTKLCVLTPHDPAAELTLLLQPGGIISGQVLGEGGVGVLSARVTPIVHDDRRVRHDSLAVRTAEDGAFVSPILAERAWQFEVQADGYATAVSEPITIGTTDARIYLERGGTLSGVVLEIDSQSPVPRMTLQANNPNSPAGSRETETSETGEFTFSGLVNGTNDIVSTDSARVLNPAVYTVEAGNNDGSQQVVLYATEGAAISGTIRSISGPPVSGMTVYAEASDPATMRSRGSMPSDEQGAYHISGLAPGAYSLAINELRHIHFELPSVLLQPRETRSGIDFALPFAVSVSGHVYDAEGAPVLGAAVEGKYYSGPFGQGRVEARADGDGAFRVFGPEPESELFIRANTNNASSSWYGPIIVSAEGVHGVELIVERIRDGVIAGVVVSESGQPIRSIVGVKNVTTDDLGLPMEYVQSGWDGGFAISVFTPGDYEIFLGPYDPEGYQTATRSAAQISLAAGGSERGLRLIYSEEAHFAISGRVIDSNNNPIAGAMINPGVLQGSTAQAISPARTDARGEFTLKMSEEGVYRLIVVAPGYKVQHVHDVETDTNGITIALEKTAKE
jgi:protocatechuate 3,4-dioxygenase beta subunit